MNEKVIETDDGKHRVVVSDYDGNFYEIDVFDSPYVARAVCSLVSMVVSVWCYGGNLDNHYIDERCRGQALSYKQMMRYAKDMFDLLNSDYHTVYGGTDSEGVEYNSIKHN